MDDPSCDRGSLLPPLGGHAPYFSFFPSDIVDRMPLLLQTISVLVLLKVAHFFTGLPVQTVTIVIPQYWYKSLVPVHHSHLRMERKRRKRGRKKQRNN